MSKEQDNKAIVGRWFTEFCGPRHQAMRQGRICHSGHPGKGRTEPSLRWPDLAIAHGHFRCGLAGPGSVVS